MKLLQLCGRKSSKYFTQVDNDDYEALSQWKWHVREVAKGRFYVYRYCKTTKKFIAIHRHILNVFDHNKLVDHKDRNPLNNQRNNLRIATRSQNNANQTKSQHKSSIYLGVHKIIRSYKICWLARIMKDSIVYRKSCDTEVEAALWYNEKAKELHGEFANLNIISSK